LTGRGIRQLTVNERGMKDSTHILVVQELSAGLSDRVAPRQVASKDAGRKWRISRARRRSDGTPEGSQSIHLSLSLKKVVITSTLPAQKLAVRRI
jgi:hypothetical protein